MFVGWLLRWLWRRIEGLSAAGSSAEPGSPVLLGELVDAVALAARHGHRPVLGDRALTCCISRGWAALGLCQRTLVLAALLAASCLPRRLARRLLLRSPASPLPEDSDAASMLFQTLADAFPPLAALADEQEAYFLDSLRRLDQPLALLHPGAAVGDHGSPAQPRRRGVVLVVLGRGLEPRVDLESEAPVNRRSLAAHGQGLLAKALTTVALVLVALAVTLYAVAELVWNARYGWGGPPKLVYLG